MKDETTVHFQNRKATLNSQLHPHTTHPLRVYRVARGLSQAELADLAEVTRETVSRLESGSAERPARRSAKSLATALEVTEAALWGSDG